MKLENVTPLQFDSYLNDVGIYVNFSEWNGVTVTPEIAIFFGLSLSVTLSHTEVLGVISDTRRVYPWSSLDGLGRGLYIRELTRAYISRQLEALQESRAAL
jgi:hypothetical protein